MAHRYRGHRSHSFRLDDDHTEVLEWRARQRTFDVGIIFVFLSAVMLLGGTARQRRLDKDMDDLHRNEAQYRARSQVWGADFRTANDLIVFLAVTLGAAELALIYLLWEM